MFFSQTSVSPSSCLLRCCLKPNGMVRYGTVPLGLPVYCLEPPCPLMNEFIVSRTERYSTYGTMRHGTVQCGATRYGSLRCGAVRYSTIRSVLFCLEPTYPPNQCLLRFFCIFRLNLTARYCLVCFVVSRITMPPSSISAIYFSGTGNRTVRAFCLSRQYSDRNGDRTPVGSNVFLKVV